MLSSFLQKGYQVTRSVFFSVGSDSGDEMTLMRFPLLSCNLNEVIDAS